MEYTKFETVSIKNHVELNEKWVQDRIAEDPSILGLGEVILKDRERRQPRAGRLDLLLQDEDANRRYEVEVQLGASDESHIIRTLEYWDIERKRYPQYDHTAVIVAEDITSRFLNVVGLFNGVIPLIAIQMKAIKSGGKVGLFFTTVVNQLSLGLVDDDEEEDHPTDRNYWEMRGSKQTVAIADELLEIARTCDPNFDLKYNKFYIGLSRNGLSRSFVIFRPKKQFLRLDLQLGGDPERIDEMESAGLDVMEIDRRGRQRVRLQPGDVKKHKEVLTQLISEAFQKAES